MRKQPQNLVRGHELNPNSLFLCQFMKNFPLNISQNSFSDNGSFNPKIRKSVENNVQFNPYKTENTLNETIAGTTDIA